MMMRVGFMPGDAADNYTENARKTSGQFDERRPGAHPGTARSGWPPGCRRAGASRPADTAPATAIIGQLESRWHFPTFCLGGKIPPPAMRDQAGRPTLQFDCLVLPARLISKHVRLADFGCVKS